jgi:hypothetical protein
MAHPTGESVSAAPRLNFDRRLKLEFHGSSVTSDAGLLPFRELDDVLGLMVIAGQTLADGRTGRNGRHDLIGRLRQSVFGRVAGYEDVNDADRLGRDPAMRWIVGGRAATKQAASTSQMGRFETEWLANDENLVALKRPVGRPPIEVRRYYANFSYQAQSWKIPRRVVAKVEWHPGELYPRIGFIVTNLSRPPERVVAFYNKRGTCEQWIKEGKGAIKWTRLSCCSFAANAVRLQLHALAYNLANFMRTLALPEAIKQWSLTSLREKLVKIGAKVVRHGRYVIFQMAEVAMPRELFQEILRLIAELRPQPPPAPA